MRIVLTVVVALHTDHAHVEVLRTDHAQVVVVHTAVVIKELACYFRL